MNETLTLLVTLIALAAGTGIAIMALAGLVAILVALIVVTRS
jgi:hypothetical protein